MLSYNANEPPVAKLAKAPLCCRGVGAWIPRHPVDLVAYFSVDGMYVVLTVEVHTSWAWYWWPKCRPAHAEEAEAAFSLFKQSVQKYKSCIMDVNEAPCI